MRRKLLYKGRVIIAALAILGVVGAYNILEINGLAGTQELHNNLNYNAPSITFNYGDMDVDWKNAITYDEDKYVLDVVDKLDAIIALHNEPGTHKVEYRLRLREEADRDEYKLRQEAVEAFEGLYQSADGYKEEFADIYGFTSAISTEITEELSWNEWEDILLESDYQEEYKEYLQYKRDLSEEGARENEVGSIYFYRDIIVPQPYEYEELYLTYGEGYNLLDGINYDKNNYTLSIENEEVFDSEFIGTSSLRYKIVHKTSGSFLEFQRNVTTTMSEYVEYNGEMIQTYAIDLSSTGTIEKNGTYSKNLTSNTYSNITISEGVTNVTLHLSGTKRLAGISLPSTMETFILWVEEGSDITLQSYSSYTAGLQPGISGGSNAKVFILGNGNLEIIGSTTSAPTSTNGATGAAQTYHVGVGGAGAYAGIDTKAMLSIYSNNENIKITGGNSVRAAWGANAYGWTGPAHTGVTWYQVSGSGGGGGGYPAMAIGTQAESGGNGGPSLYNSSNSGWSTVGNNGGDGGDGFTGGGGGAGASTSNTYYASGGLSGNATSSNGVMSLTNGSVGGNGTSSSSSNPTAGKGGTGGTSYGPSNTILEVFPIFFHYNGADLANPIGMTGGFGSETPTKDSVFTMKYGLDSIFYGFATDEEEMEAGLTNVQDVIATTPTQLGVSYNPAPPIDAEVFFVEPTGELSAVMWKNPDMESRGTGYKIPSGYSIVGYNVTKYVDDPDFESNPDSKYYTVAEVATEVEGVLKIPESDAANNVNYWSVNLVIQKNGSSERLVSPTTVALNVPPSVSVIRPDDTGATFMSLEAALFFITIDENILPATSENPAEYRVIYLQNYDHNASVLDQTALENFSRGNVHLIFESRLKEDTTGHVNRYILTATEFGLPKDNPSITSDDNIKVTFRDIRTSITNIYTYGVDVLIDEEAYNSISNLRNVAVGEEGSYTTSDDNTIQIIGKHTIVEINLENGKYAPELVVGHSYSQYSTDIYSETSVAILQGASRVTVCPNTKLTVTQDLYLENLETPLNVNKNGHLVLESRSSLYLPGDSTTNTIGNLSMPNEYAKINFTDAFQNSDSTAPAPLKILGDADISTDGLQVEIDGAYMEDEEWMGKDVIAFTSRDKLVETDYWSTRMLYGADEINYALQIYDYRIMKIEVTFPDSSKIKFPSYEEAMEYIQTTYVSSGTFTITLIDDYDRLGLGGDGLDSNDNKALKNFYKSESTVLIFNSEINPDTGERYTFKRFTEDDSEVEEIYGADNDTFALPENQLKATLTITMRDMDLSFVENVHVGYSTFNLEESVKSDNPMTYYGAYNIEGTSSDNNSRINITAGHHIGLDRDGEVQGISLIGFSSVRNYASSILYLNKVEKVDNYASGFSNYADSEVHYLKGGIYELGTIRNYAEGIKSYFDHKDAIVYSYGSGLTHSNSSWTNNLYFSDAKDAVNRDLYVFFDGDGVPTSSYANVASYVASGDATNSGTIVAKDHVISMETFIAVVSPKEGTDLEEVTYWYSLGAACEGIQNDIKEGQYEIVLIDDYQMVSADSSKLQAVNRAGVHLKFSSKYREELVNEGNRYVPTGDEPAAEVSMLTSLWNNFMQLFTEELEEVEDEEDYTGYFKLNLIQSTSSEYINFPTSGSVHVEVDNMVIDILSPDDKTQSITGGSGGLTLGADIRYTQGVVNVQAYRTTDETNTGHNPTLIIKDGNYGYIYGATTSESTVNTEVTHKIILEKGTFNEVSAGRGSYVFNRPTEIHIHDAVITDSLCVGGMGEGYGSLYLYGNTTLPYTYHFDQIYIEDNAVIIMNGLLKRYVSGVRDYHGSIYFGENSQLQLYEVPEGSATTVYNTVGNFITQGTGASLVVPKMGNGLECVRFDRGSMPPDTSKGILSIVPAPGFEYIGPVYDEDGTLVPEEENEFSKDRFKPGDKLFYYNKSVDKVYAKDLSHYNNGFIPLGMVGDSSTGYVTLGALPISMAKNNGEHVLYTSIQAACDEIDKDGTDANDIDYTIIIREEGYTITTADATAMSTYGMNAKSITFTSAYRLTEGDALMVGESVGDAVRRLVYLSGDMTCYTNMYFDNILVEFTSSSPNIYGMGFDLYLGTNKAPYLPSDVTSGNVEIVGVNFPDVYGGSSKASVSVESTHVELGSGNYNNVYGGSYNGTITGSTYVQLGTVKNIAGDVDNGPTITGDVYGGGYAYTNSYYYGSVGEDTNIVIYAATFMKSDVCIVGGGAYRYRAIVTGDANIIIHNAYAPESDISIIGTDTANVRNVYIEIAEGGKAIAKSASIYGVRGESSTSDTSTGKINGDFELRIHSGEGLTSVDGWQYSRNFLTSGSDTRRISGEINIYIGAGGAGGGLGGADALVAEIDYIDQFDNLYVGYNVEDSSESENMVVTENITGTAHVTITSLLCGIPVSTRSVNYRYGTIHLMEGSSLTLPTTGTAAAYNLIVDESLPHLYIGKENVDSATNPLVLNGDNLSGNILGENEEDSQFLNRLIIGLQSQEHNSLEEGELAEVGDNLIQFAETPDNAREYDYISGVDKFDIIISGTESGVVEYGASSLPVITHTLVEHKDANGDVTVPVTGMSSSNISSVSDTLSTVMKTLHFIIENEDEDGNYSGYDIDAGYIANTGVIDTTWSEGGDLPTGVTEIEITKIDGTDMWSGKVSLDIESYGITQKAYYAHVRDERGSVKVICLDVHSPIYTENPLVQQVDGDYQITLAMTDPTYQEVAGSDGEVHPYNASGIYQGAWTIGTTEGCPGQDEILENREMTISTNVKDVINIYSNSTQFIGTAIIPKEELENVEDMDDVVIYMYLKDNLGNTRQIAIPMSEYFIDVTIPTRIGMIAIAAEDSYLIAPKCFIINNGNNTVKSEIVGADINEDNQVQFVTGTENLGKNKMWLVLSSDYRPYDYMLQFSYYSVEYLPMAELHIGNMSPRSEGENAAYYSFQGLYNAGDLDTTSSWDLFTMKYRFTVLTN